MKRSAKSHDLTIIKNLWSTRARVEFANGKQFSIVGKIGAAIYNALCNIKHAYIQKL